MEATGNLQPSKRGLSFFGKMGSIYPCVSLSLCLESAADEEEMMKLKMLLLNYDGRVWKNKNTYRRECFPFSVYGVKVCFFFKRLSLCYTMSFCFEENIFKSGPSIVLTADVL
jgi:hypothetical protein